MKILCVADHVDPLVYSDRIKERFKDIDLVLGAGDLSLDYYEFIISSLNKPLYFVFGNHNLKRLHLFRSNVENPGPITHQMFQSFENVFGSQYIGGKVVYLKSSNLILAGLGGSIKYNKGPNQYSEAGMFFMALKMAPKLIFNRIFRGRYLDILLTHAPPRGIGDKEDRCHQGFKTFHWFMKRFRPKYLIHGHIHLYDRNALRKHSYMDTTVLNCYDHYVIEMDTEGNSNG